MDSMNLWLTPLILLPGVALLIVSTSARFNRLHDEVHGLIVEAHLHSGAHADGPHIAAHLTRRARLFRNALVALYVCVSTFAFASLLGMLAALWEETAETSTWVVLSVSAGGVVCLLFASVQLILESILSLKVIEDHQHEFEAHQHDRIEQSH